MTTTINLRGERELQPEELTPLIQSYLGSSLFKHASVFESSAHYHLQYLDFCHAKIPIQTDLPSAAEKYVFPSLFKDTETKLILTMQLLRILQFQNKLVCLVFDNTQNRQDKQFEILVISFED